MALGTSRYASKRKQRPRVFTNGMGWWPACCTRGQPPRSAAPCCLCPRSWLARIQGVLSAIPAETRQLMQQLVEQGEIERLPDDLDDIIRHAQESELAGVAFLIWAMDVYLQTTGPSPNLRNMDGRAHRTHQCAIPPAGLSQGRSARTRRGHQYCTERRRPRPGPGSPSPTRTSTLASA